MARRPRRKFSTSNRARRPCLRVAAPISWCRSRKRSTMQPRPLRRRPAIRRSLGGRCRRRPCPSRTALRRRPRAKRHLPRARIRKVRLLFIIMLALLLAAGVGVGLTWSTTTRGTELGTLTIGAWTARPRTGTSDIDPYSRATITRNGELPICTGDGVAFTATRDDNRKPLDGRCDILVSGVTPPARFWTLTLYDNKGHLVANTLERYGFTSQEIVRGADGGFEIRIASRSRAGNWLPTGGIERYSLMLRLYDTPVGVATRTKRDAPMPAIATVGCP